MKYEDFRLSGSAVDDFFADTSLVQSRTASGTVRVAGLQDLAGFRFVADDTLVRLSKKDFWSLGEDGDGFFIERLVDDDEGPVGF